jgi:hypothetical protein
MHNPFNIVINKEVLNVIHKKAKERGNKLSACLTPILKGKYSEYSLFIAILYFMQ